MPPNAEETTAAPAADRPPRVPVAATPPPRTAEGALRALKEGNGRFASGQSAPHDVQKALRTTAEGQAPFVAVLSCIDSRVPVETVFDLTIGHVFSARVAGNVVGGDVIGSLEYACGVAGTPLMVVLGHTNCGAVKGACDGVELGRLTGLLEKIRPSVESVSTDGARTSENADWVDAVAHANVERSKAALLEESAVLRELAETGEIGLVGAMYDVRTGRVTFFDDEVPSAQRA